MFSMNEIGIYVVLMIISIWLTINGYGGGGCAIVMGY